MNTYIDEAYKCNEVGTMSCIIKLDMVDQLVCEFKKLCPSVTYKITLDWDDETLYRIRFTWEKGMFGVKKPIPVLLTGDEKPPPTPKYRPPSARW
jgi:hypothetical protein